MEIPSQAKVIPPESVGKEEIREAGMVMGLDGFVECGDPFFGCFVDIFGLCGLDFGEVFDVDVY
jgi:hypothetical protein